MRARSQSDCPMPDGVAPGPPVEDECDRGDPEPLLLSLSLLARSLWSLPSLLLALTHSLTPSVRPYSILPFLPKQIGLRPSVRPTSRRFFSCLPACLLVCLFWSTVYPASSSSPLLSSPLLSSPLSLLSSPPSSLAPLSLSLSLFLAAAAVDADGRAWLRSAHLPACLPAFRPSSGTCLVCRSCLARFGPVPPRERSDAHPPRRAASVRLPPISANRIIPHLTCTNGEGTG